MTFNLAETGTDIAQLARYITALGVVLGVVFARKSPIRRPLAWLWRRNVSEPVSAAAAALIAHTVKPMIDGARTAALAQHDEQNASISQGFAAVNGRLDGIDGRLDKGAEQIAAHAADIAHLKGKRPPTARQRATDQ